MDIFLFTFNISNDFALAKSEECVLYRTFCMNHKTFFCCCCCYCYCCLSTQLLMRYDFGIVDTVACARLLAHSNIHLTLLTNAFRTIWLLSPPATLFDFNFNMPADIGKTFVTNMEQRYSLDFSFVVSLIPALFISLSFFFSSLSFLFILSLTPSAYEYRFINKYKINTEILPTTSERDR